MATTTFDFKTAVAGQFATRPTLRQITAQKALHVLVARYPLIATSYPSLTSAAPLYLMQPNGQGGWSVAPLVDVLLQALFSGNRLDLRDTDGLDHRLSLNPPQRFDAATAADETLDLAQVRIRLDHLSTDFNDLLALLPELFRQAQVDYWRASGSAQVSRDRWLQQLLRTALLHNLPLQALDEQERACVRGLVAAGVQAPPVFLVEVVFEADGTRQSRRLPNLLVMGEWDERTVILWCAPSSVVRGFASIEDFALALQQEMAECVRFDAMSWNRFELQGDVFAVQSAALLDGMLALLDPAGSTPGGSLPSLEQAFAALSDPSQVFIEGYAANAGGKALTVPDWLADADAADMFEYQGALLDLAVDQAASGAGSSLDGILDLHGYARERLREQLLEDHPDDANYFSDDLLLTLSTARGVPGGAGAGPGGGTIEHRTLTLTEFAIGNLASLQGAVLSAISHREQQLIMDWLTPDYIRQLVETVDIGGNYPRYVAQELDGPARPARLPKFAREWRSSLLFAGLQARLQGTLGLAAWRCLADYCRGRIDPRLPAVMLMPLAFRAEPAAEVDGVAGMFVLFCAEMQVVLLYRPLYAGQPLLEFTSLDAMMAAIGAPGALQASVLTWMSPAARRVYDHGGFIEPHRLQPIDDTQQAPGRSGPASFAAQFWRTDADVRLYAANRQLLLELAERESVSNAESRWAILTGGAWLLFDVLTLVLRGPVANVAWMVQAIAALDSDLPLLTQGTGTQRLHAVLDLLLNTGMALLHVRLPRTQLPSASIARPALAVRGALPPPVQGKVYLPGAFVGQPGLHLDFSWRGREGFNSLSAQQRTALRALRSSTPVNELQAVTTGRAQGLYLVDMTYHAAFRGEFYQVVLSEQGVRIVGAAGQLGPWLAFEHGQWRVDAGLRLHGGGPKHRVDAIRQRNQKDFEALQAQEVATVGQHNILAGVSVLSAQKVQAQVEHLGKLETLRERSADQPNGEALQASLQAKIVEARAMVEQAKEQYLDDHRAQIAADSRLDSLLARMSEPRFASQPLAPVIQRQRSKIRQDLIDRSVAYYNDVVDFINKLDRDHLLDNLAARPEGPSETAQYQAARRILDKQVGLLSELLQVSQALDEILPQTLKDTEIVFRDDGGARLNKELIVTGIMNQRKLNEVDLRFRLLTEIAELSLDRLSGVDEALLLSYQSYLDGTELRSAGSAQAELHGLDLPVADRLAVLGDVVEEYNIASARAAYIADTAGPAIKASRLQQYREVLATLTQAAEHELAEAVREQELAQAHAPRPQLYERRPGRRRVVQTSRGRSVIGEEVEVDGAQVIQQREAAGNTVLKTFHRQGSRWIEEAAAQPPAEVPSPNPGDAAAAIAKGRTVLSQIESVIRLAKRYIRSDEPIGLSSIIEGHIDKLREASQALARAGSGDELLGQLEENIERLQGVQRDLLTSLYLTTSHPTAASLRFLVEEQQVTVTRTVHRKPLSATDFLDVYEVRRVPRTGKARGDGLWEAHFHYPQADAADRGFVKGHLKLWSQRTLGREAQLRAAVSGHDLLAIYRGELRLSQVEGVIPFD
ncbi:MAG TPA: hypothetical protein VJS90_17370 [Pseudomonas sp.]|uniref:hypothetical protein n=1 Tax=Pseudomonas sp. TaxID=306 RepID=UPI002B46CFD5|nr:hypothetical protein [Pseudomonas sp.]HKS14804.1 hypothetical protein [Pseudomonas sp.]